MLRRRCNELTSSLMEWSCDLNRSSTINHGIIWWRFYKMYFYIYNLSFFFAQSSWDGYCNLAMKCRASKNVLVLPYSIYSYYILIQYILILLMKVLKDLPAMPPKF